MEKSQCVILETIFKHFGKMYLENIPESERNTIIKYIYGEGFNQEKREAVQVAEKLLRDFWAKVDRERITVSRGGENDNTGKSVQKDNGDS